MHCNGLLREKTTSLSSLNNNLCIKGMSILFIIDNKEIGLNENVELTFHNFCIFKITYFLLSYIREIISF